MPSQVNILNTVAHLMSDIEKLLFLWHSSDSYVGGGKFHLSGRKRYGHYVRGMQALSH